MVPCKYKYQSTLRKQRAVRENIFLIETINFGNKFNERTYIVLGTSNNIYDVTIKNTPECTCQDYRSRNNRCKHIYFILIRILLAQNEDSETYTDEELCKMFGTEMKTNVTIVDNLQNSNDTVTELPTDNDQCYENESFRENTSLPCDSTDTQTLLEDTTAQLTTNSQYCDDTTTDDYDIKYVANDIEIKPIELIYKDDSNIDINSINNYMLVIEKTNTNDFSIIPIEYNLLSTIYKYIETSYGIESRNNARKLFSNDIKIEDIINNDDYNGLYLTKVNDNLIELYDKTINKINVGWIFSNYINETKIEKLIRFIIVKK
jgi:hypothetical protein